MTTCGLSWQGIVSGRISFVPQKGTVTSIRPPSTTLKYSLLKLQQTVKIGPSDRNAAIRSSDDAWNC